MASANSTRVSAQINRRTLLAALPAAAVAGAVPAATTETPIRRLYMEWSEAYRLANEPDAPSAKVDALLEQMGDLERQIHQTPPQNAADMLMKIGSFSNWGDFDIADCAYGTADTIWAEARALVA